MKTMQRRWMMIVLWNFIGVLGAETVAAAQVDATVSAGIVNRDPYPIRRVTFPGGVTGLPDLTYTGMPGYRPLKLDLYLPPAPQNGKGPRPVVIFMHGGGWQGGTPRTTGAFTDWPSVLAQLSAKGYVVASLSYRFASEAPFPAAIQDVKSSIRWLRANAALYNIDKSRFLTWGPSAGGQLAALAAVSCGVAALLPPASRAPLPSRLAESAAPPPPVESECVQGGVGWYGVYDFTVQHDSQPPAGSPATGEEVYLGCTSRCSAEQQRDASPITYVDRNDPPMLIIHGDNDHTVPVEHAKRFYAALQRAGVSSELVVEPGIDHSWIGPTPEATRKASLDALQHTFDFIDKTIGDK